MKATKFQKIAGVVYYFGHLLPAMFALLIFLLKGDESNAEDMIALLMLFLVVMGGMAMVEFLPMAIAKKKKAGDTRNLTGSCIALGLRIIFSGLMLGSLFQGLIDWTCKCVDAGKSISIPALIFFLIVLLFEILNIVDLVVIARNK